jgi:hypothetical protein
LRIINERTTRESPSTERFLATHLPVLPLLHLVPQPLRSPQSLLLQLFSLAFTPTALLPRRGRLDRGPLDRLGGEPGVLGRRFGEGFRVGGLALGLTGGEGGELGLDRVAVRGVGGWCDCGGGGQGLGAIERRMRRGHSRELMMAVIEALNNSFSEGSGRCCTIRR